MVTIWISLFILVAALIVWGLVYGGTRKKLEYKYRKEINDIAYTITTDRELTELEADEIFAEIHMNLKALSERDEEDIYMLTESEDVIGIEVESLDALLEEEEDDESPIIPASKTVVDRQELKAEAEVISPYAETAAAAMQMSNTIREASEQWREAEDEIEQARRQRQATYIPWESSPADSGATIKTYESTSAVDAPERTVDPEPVKSSGSHNSHHYTPSYESSSSSSYSSSHSNSSHSSHDSYSSHSSSSYDSSSSSSYDSGSSSSYDSGSSSSDSGSSGGGDW